MNGVAEILTLKACSNSWQGGCKGNQANVSESLQVSLAQRSCVVYLGPLHSTWQGKWNERPLVCQVDVMGTTWELLGQGVGRGGSVLVPQQPASCAPQLPYRTLSLYLFSSGGNILRRG